MKGCYLTIEQARKLGELEMQEQFEMQDREELKDFLQVNDIDTIINFIQGIERKRVTLENTIDTQKTMMQDMVSKSRYNALVKEYNKKVEDKTKWKKTL